MSEPLLRIENLCKSFGGLTVTDGVSLSLAPGARTALIGPNGAGKTTLINLVAGLERPDSGRVILDGRDVTRMRAVDRVRGGLVRSFQVTRLFFEMSPAEHLGLAILQREGRSGALHGGWRASSEVREEVEERLSALGLLPLAERPVAAIAYGQQRLLELAIALTMRPKVLLLDEPGAGVPQDETGRIEAAIAALPSDLAVLMIDHDMDLVFRFAREVAVLAAGRLIFQGSPAAVAEDPHVREAYLGNYAHAGRAA